VSRAISAETYRERILHELRVAESKARARVAELIDMAGESDETDENHDSASHYADGIHAAYLLVRGISTRAAYKTKAPA
jgi:hypothetical protein